MYLLTLKKLKGKEIDDELLRARSSFYKNRPILIPPGKGESQQLDLGFS